MTPWRKALFCLEIFALLPATVLFGPLLWAGVFAGAILIWAELFDSRTMAGSGWLTALGGSLLFLLIILSGIVGLVAAWGTLLGGAQTIRRNDSLRWPVRISLVLGLSAAMYMLVSMLHTTADFQGRDEWFMLLPPAMLVGAHQLYLLGKGNAPPDIAG